ncbi:unnamed protein product [Pedinophyceae sp. YPF-701]|nr:unnamed protein product [Pedinophyceae sp. YPF-701]
MGKLQKAGKTGNAAQYLTRNQALKKLQLKLHDFRRLCILKGVHPREPKKKPHGRHKTYYHVKDINFLLHEPLLERFREIRAYERKIRRALGRKNRELADRLKTRRPGYRLDHLVRERYPSFVDAVRDLDDPLSMLHLFAALPAERRFEIPQKQVEAARRLVLEFQAWVVKTNALRKVFVSVKGTYYQAEVMGESVTWLTPHALSQALPSDVDYRVMLTFLEFYITLAKFVNFKLYHALGVRYPPILDDKLDRAAAGLEALMRDIEGDGDGEEGDGSDGSELEPDSGSEDGDGGSEEGDGGEGEGGGVGQGKKLVGGSANAQADDDAEICRTLFRGLVFYLGRETPREMLTFVIRSFGGVAGWDGEGSPVTERDPSVTHHVVDRPQQGHRYLSREYVQPQWVLDSANFRCMAPTELYAPGRVPPPHLSPFVDDEEEGYVPDHARVMKKLQQVAAAARRQGLTAEGGFVDDEAAEDAAEDAAAAGAAGGGDAGAAAALERRYNRELTKELGGGVKDGAPAEAIDEDEEEDDASDEAESDEAGGSSDDDDGSAEEELGAPAAGGGRKRGRGPVPGSGTVELPEGGEDEGLEAGAAARSLMTSKQRKFYHRIKEAQHHKKQKVEVLERRKAAHAEAEARRKGRRARA